MWAQCGVTWAQCGDHVSTVWGSCEHSVGVMWAHCGGHVSTVWGHMGGAYLKVFNKPLHFLVVFVVEKRLNRFQVLWKVENITWQSVSKSNFQHKGAIFTMDVSLFLRLREEPGTRLERSILYPQWLNSSQANNNSPLLTKGPASGGRWLIKSYLFTGGSHNPINTFRV